MKWGVENRTFGLPPLLIFGVGVGPIWALEEICSIPLWGAWHRSRLDALARRQDAKSVLLSPIPHQLLSYKFSVSSHNLFCFFCCPSACGDFAELWQLNARLTLQKIRIQRLGITVFLMLRFHGLRLKPFYDWVGTNSKKHPTSTSRPNNHVFTDIYASFSSSSPLLGFRFIVLGLIAMTVRSCWF